MRAEAIANRVEARDEARREAQIDAELRAEREEELAHQAACHYYRTTRGETLVDLVFDHLDGVRGQSRMHLIDDLIDQLAEEFRGGEQRRILGMVLEQLRETHAKHNLNGKLRRLYDAMEEAVVESIKRGSLEETRS